MISEFLHNRQPSAAEGDDMSSRKRGRPRKHIHVVIKDYALRREPPCPVHGCSMIARYTYTTSMQPDRQVLCLRCMREESTGQNEVPEEAENE